MQIPTVEPMQMTCTSAPMTPRDETSLAGRAIAETKKINLIYSKPDSDNVKQSPTFSELSKLDSGDDDIPLAQLSRLSPSPPPVVQGTNKRGRAASPAPTNVGRPIRRLVSSITFAVTALEPCISGAPTLRMSPVKWPSHLKRPERWDSIIYGPS